MTSDQATLLLASLLNRISSDRSRYAGLVSDQEIEAIAAFAQPMEQPKEIPETKPATALPQLTTPPRMALESVGAPAQNSDVILCLDFGTAKSKAFAARDVGDGEPDLFDLGIGNLDEDLDGSVFSVASTLWVDDSGRVFVGSEAVRKSELAPLEERARIESLKQFISQANSPNEVQSTSLTQEEDPFRSGLTHEHALLLYLGYLTDISLVCLENKGFTRLSRRRFALPCWEEGQRAWAAEYLGNLVARAQVVADTFQGRWKSGLGIREVMAVCDATRQHADSLRQLVDEVPDAKPSFAQRWGGVLEPIASASARMYAEFQTDRKLMFVADIGAGTTDVALFWVVQDNKGRRAFPVSGTTKALRMAGDHLDRALLKLLLDKGNIEPRLARRAETKLRLGGLQRLKEALYTNGSVQTRLINDALVTVTQDEFENSPLVSAFNAQLIDLVKAVMDTLDPSWALHAERITLVLSGGGSTLPAASSLTNVEGKVGGRVARFRLAPLVPKGIDDGLRLEYPRLAVALGGSLDTIAERSALDQCPAGSEPHGPLERFPTRGV